MSITAQAVRSSITILCALPAVFFIRFPEARLTLKLRVILRRMRILGELDDATTYERSTQN